MSNLTVINQEKILAYQNDPKYGNLITAISTGNISKLTSAEKLFYVKMICDSVGLNPITKPFEYMTLKGKEVLYANKGCAEQLRNIHNIKITIISKESIDGTFYVTARASMPNGREDEDIGACPIATAKYDVKTNTYLYVPYPPEERSNAVMKAMTKAKRRVTLSICGLNMLDESEIDSIPKTFINADYKLAEAQSSDPKEDDQSKNLLPKIPTPLDEYQLHIKKMIFTEAKERNIDARKDAEIMRQIVSALVILDDNQFSYDDKAINENIKLQFDAHYKEI